MSRTTAQLLTMESSFPQAHSTLRLMEPADSCQKTLWNRLVDGTYDKPFIIDSGHYRFLHFDLDTVQSAMCLKNPDKLSLAYTRKMMGFLLFNRAPARILLLGLGGGSLAKFCYRHLPRTAVTAVELNSDVIALRAEFFIPPDDDRFRVIRADGADYLARLGRSKDVIIADACNRMGIAPELDTIEIYQHVYRSLTQRGVFVSNICGDLNNCTVHLDKIRRVFQDNFLTLRVAPHGNVVVFAFKEHRSEIDWEKLEVASARLKRIFSLDFPRFARRLALDWKLRRCRCVSN